MAKYGAFRYGTSTLYGTGGPGPQPTFTGELVWSIQFDWNGDGVLDGTNEAQYVTGLETSRGRRYYISPSGEKFENFQEGTASLTLENRSRRYDPYNTSSPLYGNVKPGRLCQIKAVTVADGTEYTLFTGKIDNIKPISGGGEKVRIDLVDGWRWLNDAEISIERRFRGTVSDSVELALTAADYPFSRSVTADSQPVWVYDPDKRTAASVINDLAQSCLGQFFIARDGQARFYPRDYTGMTNHAIDQSVLLKEIALSQPWENIRNKIRVYANQVGKRFSDTIWTYGGVLLVPYGDTIKVYVDSNTDAILDYITPRPGVDYTANTAGDGSGTDKTALVQCVMYNARSHGAVLHIKSYYPYDVYVIGLRARGNVRVTQQSSYYAEDTTSVATYGPRRFSLDNPFLQDKGYASAFATIIKNGLKDPAKNPVIMVEQRPSVQYAFELMDKVTLTASTLGISGEVYYIGQIEHKWMEETGQAVTTTVYLQNVIRDSTSITPQPYYPGQPTIETIPVNPWNPNQQPPVAPPTPPTITPGSECINNMAAPANGPFRTSLSGTLMNYDAGVGNYRYAWVHYPCYIRSANATNKTAIRMYAVTEQLTDFAWTALPESMAGFHLWAYDYSGQPLAEVTWDAVTDQGAGVRTGTISLPSAALVEWWLAIMDEDTDSGNGVNVTISQHAIGAHNAWVSTFKFSDDGLKASIPVWDFGASWKVTLPALTASAGTYTAKIRMTVDGESATITAGAGDASKYDPNMSALPSALSLANTAVATGDYTYTSSATAATNSVLSTYLNIWMYHSLFGPLPASTLELLELSLTVGTETTQLWPASTGNKRITINYLDLYNICSKDG